MFYVGEAMFYVGIDPGLSGAIATVNPLGVLCSWDKMPVVGNRVDGPAIMRFFNAFYAKPKVVIEQQQVMPKQGSVSGFTIGVNYGILLGVLGAMRISFLEVRPKIWQKEVLKGKARGRSEVKATAYRTAVGLWPNEKWLASPKCKKPHDGAVDAALIAEYCRRMLAPSDILA